MELGPFTLTRTKRSVELAGHAAQLDADTREFGGTGTQFFGGLLTQEDYNTDLLPPARYLVYDKMRKGDGQVRAGLMAIKLPLLRADWSIEPASKDAKDQEIAEFIHEDLFERVDSHFTWLRTLRHVLLMLDYGSMPFEVVWDLEDDMKLHLLKLAPRMPASIHHWHVNNVGQFDGITQLAYKDNGIHEIRIPGNKMVVFVNELEGSDYRGISILRSAYKHWWFKDNLYKIDAIAKEKRSIGVDVIKLKGPVDAKRRSDAESAAMTMHAHEKMFFVEFEDENEYRVEGTTGSLADALASIEHHDIRILRSILAEFLSMGSKSAVGSEAMHRDKTSFFVMALGAIANEITDTFNKQLIRPWVDLNFPNVMEYPKLVHSRLETRDMKDMASAIARLVNVGAITANEETENAIRELLELPELEPGSPRPVPLPKGTPNTPPPTKNGQRAAAQAVQQAQVNRLVKVGSDIFAGKQFNRIRDVNIPYKSRLVDVIEDEDLREELIDGLYHAFVIEMERQSGDEFDPESLRATLDSHFESVVY